MAKKAEEKEIIKETIVQDNSPLLNKIVVCLYIVIALLVINTIILAVKGTDFSTTKSNNNTQTQAQTGDNNTEYDVSKFEKVDAKGFMSKLNEDKYNLFYIGRSTCGWCVKFVPTLNAVQELYNYKTIYVDITAVDATDIQPLINSYFEKVYEEKVKENPDAKKITYGSTPMMLITKNGEIVDNQVGASDQTTFEALISKYFNKK